jgi:hypothetical protein
VADPRRLQFVIMAICIAVIVAALLAGFAGHPILIGPSSGGGSSGSG